MLRSHVTHRTRLKFVVRPSNYVFSLFSITMSGGSSALFVLCIIIFCVALLQSKTVVIKTKQGALKGLELKSRGGTKYHAFLGIPYAKPPTGELRFEPPQPSDSWAGERDATTQPPVCTQRASFATNESKVYVIGQEDCLYLNVYTPSNVSGELLPTLIYIHGGALIAGSAGFHDPHYFMDHATVLVILQYRLNLFGFLSAADEILPGNYGLKDQVAALKWVQQNIAYFGGNPERVTIFGHSAGACSVHYHMHSPLSKGLFHQAISQSGTALASWAQIPSSVARQKFLSVGLLAGCPTQSTKVLVKCLKKVPAEKLVQIHSKFFVWDVEPSVTFSVVVEPKSVVGAFLIENPWKQNVLHDVPWIVGFTSGEGAIKAARYLSDGGKLADELNASFKRLFPLLFYYQYQYWLKPDHYDIISEALKQYYFGEKKIGFETAHNLVDMITDGFFAFDSIEAANRHTNKLYVYYYDHRNERSFSEVNGNCPIELGVTHADDLLSIFHVPMLFPKLSSDSDINVSKRILKYWVNFGHTGNPSKDNSWFPSKSEELDYLHITTTEDRMEKGLLQDRYKFWKKLFIDHPSNIVTNETNEKDEL